MSKEDLEKEIDICSDMIKGIQDMLQEFYGTKEQYFSKIALLKCYSERLYNARREYAKYIEEDLD